jgi:hypothetical protein
MEFFVQAIAGRKIESQQDSYSDDDMALLRPLKRPTLSNFWTMTAQRWQGLKKS